MPDRKRTSSPARRIVVLGGTGFLGSEITRAFLSTGASVTVVSRHPPTDARATNLQGATVILGDAGDSTVLESTLDGADHVVHAVGSANPAESQRDPIDAVSQTLPGLITLLESVSNRPNIGITYCSSGGTVYGEVGDQPINESIRCEPITLYGVTKLAAENYVAMYCRRHGLAGRILRISNAYGPTQSSARGQGIVAALVSAAWNNTMARVYGNGRIVRDYVHVADVGDAAAQLANSPIGFLRVNIGTGVGHSILDLIQIVEHTSGRTLPIEWLPERGFDARCSILDPSQLRSAIEWRPRTLEEGIAQMWTALSAPAGAAR